MTYAEEAKAGYERGQRYLNEVPKFEKLLPDAVLFDRLGIKVERRIHHRYAWYEYHVTIRYPNRRKRAFSINYDDHVLARKALLIVFGHVPYLRGGWHARGGPVLVDVIPPPVNTMTIGYANPRNLANY